MSISHKDYVGPIAIILMAKFHLLIIKLERVVQASSSSVSCSPFNRIRSLITTRPLPAPSGVDLLRYSPFGRQSDASVQDFRQQYPPEMTREEDVDDEVDAGVKDGQIVGHLLDVEVDPTASQSVRS